MASLRACLAMARTSPHLSSPPTRLALSPALRFLTGDAAMAPTAFPHLHCAWGTKSTSKGRMRFQVSAREDHPAALNATDTQRAAAKPSPKLMLVSDLDSTMVRNLSQTFHTTSGAILSAFLGTLSTIASAATPPSRIERSEERAALLSSLDQGHTSPRLGSSQVVEPLPPLRAK